LTIDLTNNFTAFVDMKNKIDVTRQYQITNYE